MSLIDLRALALLAVAGVALTGCATPKAADGTALLTPTQQYRPKVEETPQTLALARHPTGLSDTQRQALASFAAQYREDGTAELSLRVPQGLSDSLTPSRMATEVVSSLEDFGVSRSRVRVVAYDGASDPVAPVVLSYWRFTVTPTDCSGTWDNVGATGSNRVTKNFGCTTTANFAAMLADPRDLLRPVPMDPADNSRRQVVLGKYRQGEVTSTTKDDQANGTVSKAVQ